MAIYVNGDPVLVASASEAVTQPLLNVYISPYFEISQVEMGAVVGPTGRRRADPSLRMVDQGHATLTPGHLRLNGTTSAGLMGPVEALVDTGASHDDYISEAVVDVC